MSQQSHWRFYVAQMADSLIHDNCGVFYIMSNFWKLFQQIHFKWTPAVFDYCNFMIELNFKSMILPYFQVFVLFDILSFDSDA